MRQIRVGLWFIAAAVWLTVGTTYAGEPTKLNPKGFKDGCVCVGQGYNGSAAYEMVRVVAEMPGGGDYWVFYPEHLEERHRRHDGTLIALKLSRDAFIPRGKNGKGRLGRTRCPESMWGITSSITAER